VWLQLCAWRSHRSEVAPRHNISGGKMARVTVEDCLTMIPNRFLLVMVAVKRTKQLYKGAEPLIENKADNKKVVLALREIATGKIDFKVPGK
jgi:DNA-directed RNA polymerase subunit omega